MTIWQGQLYMEMYESCAQELLIKRKMLGVMILMACDVRRERYQQAEAEARGS